MLVNIKIKRSDFRPKLQNHSMNVVQDFSRSLTANVVQEVCFKKKRKGVLNNMKLLSYFLVDLVESSSSRFNNTSCSNGSLFLLLLD